MTTESEVPDTVKSRRNRIVRRLLKWADTNQRTYPWRQRRDPYQVMVAEVLLKRTTSTAAARLYADFLEKFPSFAAIAESPAAYVEDSLRSVGLHKQRAKGIKEMAESVEREYGGELPHDVQSLEHIPHVGPYVARAVMSFGYGKPAAVVDSNVARILRRVFAKSMPARVTSTSLQRIADALLPRKRHREFNYALLDLGAKVCRYDRPRCDQCPLRPVCDFAQDR